jgi:hypothetical protein
MLIYKIRDKEFKVEKEEEQIFKRFVLSRFCLSEPVAIFDGTDQIDSLTLEDLFDNLNP